MPAITRIKNPKSKLFDLFKQIAALRVAIFCSMGGQVRLIRRRIKLRQ
jgi:hypothetical protein